ncbi:MAG: hypothetical protein AAB368_07475, partial [bacterium]
EALREIGWQEHATFGPPFLEGGVTVFDLPASWATSHPAPFARRHRLRIGPKTEFAWPLAPGADGRPVDLRLFPSAERAGDFPAQLMDPGRTWAWAPAVHPGRGLLAGYAWRRADFPWVGNWEEHRDRESAPWGGRTEARGIEFGASPFAQGRDAMRALGSLRGTPVLTAIAKGARRDAVFYAFLAPVPAGCAGVDAVSVAHGVISVRLRGGPALSFSSIG